MRLVGGLSPGDTGYATVTARWDQGWFSYTAEVRETSGARDIPVRATLAGIDDGLVAIEEDFPRGLIVGTDACRVGCGGTCWRSGSSGVPPGQRAGALGGDPMGVVLARPVPLGPLTGGKAFLLGIVQSVFSWPGGHLVAPASV